MSEPKRIRVKILDPTGHTELEVPIEEAIQAIERAMNEFPRGILVEETPGAESYRVDKPADLVDVPDASIVWVLPVLVGGRDE